MIEESLFGAALERSHTVDRQAFLDQACVGDLFLRERVARLLAAHERTVGILDLPVAPPDPLDDAWPPLDGILPADRDGPLIADRYKLVEPIGEGGMGTVWLAEQVQPVRRRVAVKIVKAGISSKSILARFGAERQALAMMDHPNIAKVLDGGATADGRPFFVMEHVEGVPITDHCDAAGLSIPERIKLFIAVCQAVQHAHTKGIIHRDLKPSNVLVALGDGGPVPKVIDFGVAKATGPRPADGTTLTQHGQLVGTPMYMSPEQANTGGVDVDTRTDVYSLGVVLYELLAGSTPIEGKHPGDPAFVEMLWKIREEEPPSPSRRLATTRDLPGIAARRGTEPSRLGRTVAGELDWIAMKALEKDRARRYETASALATDLQNYLNHEPVTAGPPSVRYRMRKFVRRNKGPVVAAALAALALVGGIVGTTWGMVRANDSLAAARRSERGATDQLFEALLNRARAGRYGRQMGQRHDSLAAVAQAAAIRPDERLRDEAIAALALPDVRRVPIARPTLPGSTAVAYDGPYRRYAYADTEGFVSVRQVSDGREVRRLASGPIPRAYLEFSPDDRFLLARGDPALLRVWRLADGELALPEDLLEGWAFAFSPDGRTLAVGQQGRARCFDLETGREVANWKLPASAHSLAFRPDGRALAVGYSAARPTSVYDPTDGTPLAELAVGPIRNQVVGWQPDGKRLAVAGVDPRIQIWDLAANRRVATLTGHVQNVTDLTFHPGGALLASYSWDGVLRLWDPSTGRPLLQLPLTVNGRLRFNADGRSLGTSRRGDQDELLEATPSQVYRTLTVGEGLGKGAYTPSDVSPDGRLLAVGTVDGAGPGVRLWDLLGGRELAGLPSGTRLVCFDGDWGSIAAPDRTRGPRAALLTSGSDGVQRWPVTADDPAGLRLHLGAPRQVSPQPRAWFERGADGRAIGAVIEGEGAGTILDLETGATVRELAGRHPGGEVRAVSADRRWAATCGWHSDRVRLWEIGTGRMVHEWALGKKNFVYFTPDSRTLIIAREDEFSFWDLASLQPIRRLRREIAHFPGHVAFSPDGRLIALEMEPAVIHLKELATGRTVAKLEDPQGDRATWQGFTPDGTRLVVVAAYADAIHVWDLRAVRSRLAGMGLDWDWPEFPAGSPAVAATELVTVEAMTAEQAAQTEIDQLRRSVAAAPNSAFHKNNLAWAYLTAPGALRDVEAALPLAEQAMGLAPESPSFRNTLGAASYRVGRYREAADLLRVNVAAQVDNSLAFDLYYLAMSYHHLGDSARARDFYDWAVRWVAMHPGPSAADRDELASLRAEAEELLAAGPIDAPPR